LNNKKNILITGANGQLGMEFRSIAKTFPEYNFLFASKEELSISDKEAVKFFFTINRIYCCINCGAYTNVDKAESEKEKAFEINGTAVGYLAGICKNHHSHFIHISTDYVFPGNASTPYKETDLPNPLNSYGASKLAGENLAIENNEASIIIRSSWVYSSYGKNFVKTMIRLLKKKEIGVVNDQEGSPTYAADLANAIMKIISTDHFIPGIYHYCNDGIITWYTFAEEIKKIIFSHCIIKPITTKESDSYRIPTPAKRPLYSALDTEKIRLVFSVEVPLWQESLKKFLALLTKPGA